MVLVDFCFKARFFFIVGGFFCFSTLFLSSKSFSAIRYAKNSSQEKRIWPSPPMSKYKTASRTRKNLSIVMLSGLSGAALGLSTISFYKRPEESWPNITIGFALGIVLGAMINVYRLASESPKKGSSYLEQSSLYHGSLRDAKMKNQGSYFLHEEKSKFFTYKRL